MDTLSLDSKKRGYPTPSTSITTAKAKNIQSESWEKARHLMDVAFTQEEIEVAEVAMREHLDRWPEDYDREPWHGWGAIRGALMERRAESDALGLKREEFEERERLLQVAWYCGDFVSDPTVIPTWQRIVVKLEQWLDRFPNDETICRQRNYVLEEIDLAEQGLRLIADSEG